MAEEAGYEIVVPFVVVSSAGGAYEDHAFCAGVQYGIDRERTRAEMDQAPWQFISTVPTPLVPQYDLLAMEAGADILATPDPEQPEWTHVHMERAAPPEAVSP